MNTEVTVVSSKTDKRRQSDENNDEEPAQKIFKAYSAENIKHLEDLYNIILDVKSRLNAVYKEAGLKLKNSFESIQLIVPELKIDLSLPPMPIAEPEKQEEPCEKPEPPSQSKKSSQSSITGSVVDKWTLLHHGQEPGLIELLPDTRIYVSEEELTRCKLIKTDMRKFARVLLPEVFSKKGFRKCSFSGYGPNGKRPKNPGTARPGLDEYARNVFLEYVTQHAEDSGWEIVSRKLMYQALSDKVNTMRYRR